MQINNSILQHFCCMDIHSTNLTQFIVFFTKNMWFSHPQSYSLCDCSTMQITTEDWYQGSSPGWGNYVLFLGKTRSTLSCSFPPRHTNATSITNAMGRTVIA